MKGNLDSIRQTLGTTPSVLSQLLENISSEQMSWKQSEERWSISEILAHLVEVEEKVLGLRAKRIFLEDEPTLIPYDQMVAYLFGIYSNKDGFEMLEKFTEARQKSFEFLNQIQVSDLERIGKHPEVGDIKLVQILNLWAFHDLGHIRQIAEIIRAINFWDGIGSLQVYYKVTP